MKYPLCLALLIVSSPALAQGAARGIQDCENIKGDLAYNQCLASFGPKVGERRSRAVAAEPVEAGGPPVVTRGRSRGAASYRRGRRGRMSASFEVGRRSEVRSARKVGRAYRGRGRSYVRRRR